MPLYGVLAYIATVAVVFTFRLLSEDYVEATNDGVIACVCLSAAWYFRRVTRRFSKTDATRRCWKFLSLGALFHGTGHLVYSIAEFTIGDFVSAPSPPDILIYCGELCYIFGLSSFLSHLNRSAFLPPSNRKIIANGLIVVLAVLSVYFVMIPAWTDETTSIWARLINSIFPIIDLILAGIFAHLFLAFYTMGNSPLARPWIILIASYVVFFAADNTYLYLDATGQYHPYAFSNPGWGLAYMLTAYAAREQLQLMRSFDEGE